MFLRARSRVEGDLVKDGSQSLPFADILDAWVDGGALVLVTTAGERRMRVRRGDAMALLDAVLDGIARAHPRSPYRSPAPAGNEQPSVDKAEKRPRLRRRTASTGGADLMIGRTLYH